MWLNPLFDAMLSLDCIFEVRSQSNAGQDDNYCEGDTDVTSLKGNRLQ